MSAAPEVTPSVLHPAWCWPTLCRTDRDGTVYHRGIALETGAASIDLEQVGDEPAVAFAQGLNNEQLDAVTLAKLGAELLRVAALLAAAHPLAAEDGPC